MVWIFKEMSWLLLCSLFIIIYKRKSEQLDDHLYKRLPLSSLVVPVQSPLQVNDNQSVRSRDIDIPKFFQDNEGPYTIWIQYKNLSEKEPQVKRLSSLKIRRIICSRYKNINLICSKLKSKIEVSCKNLFEANK